MDERRKSDVSLTVSHSPSTTQPPSHDSQSPRTPTLRRKHEHPAWPRHQLSFQTPHLLIFILLTCCFSFSSASLFIEESMVEVVVQTDRLAQKGSLLVDLRPPPNPNTWTLATEHDDLQRRSDPFGASNQNQNAKDDSSSSASSSSMISTAVRPSATKSMPIATASPKESASPLPIAFDKGFSGNITDSCSAFMYGFLTNTTFKSCLPLSLLLQNSNTFFQASKSFFQITQTLDATCNINLDTCEPLMSSLATNLTASANCASDLSSENPLIIQAHLGLLAYKPLYTAACLRSTSHNYCYADAVTNASSPTDSYIYYLPLNVSLPAGYQPTCNTCIQDTMAVFSAASADRTSALASDYVAAATQINMQCGPGFVNASLAPAIKNSSPAMAMPSHIGVVALAMLVGSWLL